MKIRFILLLLITTLVGRAETFRGVATSAGPLGKESVEVIIIYDRDRPVLLSAKEEGGKQLSVASAYHAKISVRWNSLKSTDHDFIITSYPDIRGTSLVGYFLEEVVGGQVPVILRIDVWDPESKFYLYDPNWSPGRIFVGVSASKK